jgi:hypothetical protein
LKQEVPGWKKKVEKERLTLRNVSKTIVADGFKAQQSKWRDTAGQARA